MFHTLFDYKDQNQDFNVQNHNINNDTTKNKFKFGGLNGNYFGKGNRAIDQYNRKKSEMENDANFEKTKNKIKLVVFRNGFILNNGPFRDRSVYENNEFLREVERGIIPQELIRKGIKDLGILLINRKREMFRSPLYQSLPSSLNYVNVSKNPNQFKNKRQNFNEYSVNDHRYQDNGKSKHNQKYDTTFVPQTPIGTRNQRNNIFYNTNTFINPNKFDSNISYKRTSSLPKESKIVTLDDIIKGKNEKENKFTAFSGCGQLLGSANIDGVRVDQIEKNNDYLSSKNWGITDGFNLSSQSDYVMTYDELGIQIQY
jgi:hypothetical protein